MNKDENNILEEQIGNAGGEETVGLGHIDHFPGQKERLDKEEQESLDRFNKQTSHLRLGEGFAERNGMSADIREGWIPVDRESFGIRSQFYPADWEFRIKPATVEAIKNWSSIDEENLASTNTVFNEIIKSCVSIVTPNGNVPAFKMNSWDRFFLILKVREYTFAKGENTISYNEECDMCGHELTYTLRSEDLFYEFPDEDLVEKYWDQEERCWVIDPKEYDVRGYGVVKLYVPTLEKDDAIVKWAYAQAQQDKQLQEAFIKFLPWMLDRAPKDPTLLDKKIKECKREFKSWDNDMFLFMEDVLKNITINPSEKLTQKCPNCGEEVSAAVRFPNGISSLFTIQGRHKKFGSK